MSVLQRLSGLVFALLLLVVTAGTAQAQCTRYLNATDGDDGNDGLSSTTAWRSFEFAYNTAPSGCTISTAAGEYFYEDDSDGILLDGGTGKSMTYNITEYAGSSQLLFSEDGFEVDAAATVTITGVSGATIVFGDGIINNASNFPANTHAATSLTFTTGTFSTSLPLTVGDSVTDITRWTDASFSAGDVVYAFATRAVTVDGDDTVNAGSELPNGEGTVNLTFPATYTGSYTVTTAWSVSGSSTVINDGSGEVTLSGITFTSGGASAIENNLDGTMTTGVVTETGGATVSLTNALDGTMNIGGSTAESSFSDVATNDGALELDGNVQLNDDFTNNGTTEVNGWTLSIAGVDTYSTPGDITSASGSGTVQFEGTSTIPAPSGEYPNVKVTSGTLTFGGETINGNVTTSGSGGVFFNAGAATTVDGWFVAGGSGTVSNDAATPVTVNEYYENNAGTLMLNAGATITVLGDFTSSATLDWLGGTLDVNGDFTRTSGTINAGSGGTLTFSGEDAQFVQGGTNFTVPDVLITGDGTIATFMSGSVDALGDFTIDTDAQLALQSYLIRLIGQTSVMTNDGTYTADETSKIIFAPLAAGATQMLQGSGLYSNLEIRQEDPADNVTLGSDVTMSGNLEFTSGGIDCAGFSFDLSDDLVDFPHITGTLPDGTFFVPGCDFNPSGTPYDLTYDGTGDFTVSDEFTDGAHNVNVHIDGTLTLAEDEEFTGNLWVEADAIVDLVTFVLTASGTDATHTVSGDITTGGVFLITGTGSVDGTNSGTVSNMTVDTDGTVTVNALLSIGTLIMDDLATTPQGEEGVLNLGLTYDSGTDTPGDITTFTQNNGTVKLTSAIDYLTLFELTGGTFNHDGLTAHMRGADVVADNATVLATTGYIAFNSSGTIDTDTDNDEEGVGIPRFRINGGGITVTMLDDLNVTETLEHTNGNLDLGAFTLEHTGSVWNFLTDGSGDDYLGTGLVYINSDSNTLTMTADPTVPNLTVNTSDDTFTLLSEPSTDNHAVTVTTAFVMEAGTVALNSNSIVLTGAGTAFDHQAGALTSAWDADCDLGALNGNGDSVLGCWGMLVFDAGAAQDFNADDLTIPALWIQNDVTFNSTSFTVEHYFHFGSGDDEASLLFADGDALVTFSDGIFIVKETETGTIANAPVFAGTASVWYWEPGTTSTELPAEVVNLQIDPAATTDDPNGTTEGDVVLADDLTVTTLVDIVSGNLDTGGNTLTMGEGSTVQTITANNTILGTSLEGGPYTVIYDTDEGDFSTSSIELPGTEPDPDVVDAYVSVEVNGGGVLTLHEDKAVQDFTANGDVDLDGNTLEVEGTLTINADMTNVDDLILGGDLVFGANGSIDALATLTFNGCPNQDITLNADLTIGSLVVDQCEAAGKEAAVTSTVTLLPADGDFDLVLFNGADIDASLVLVNGLLVTNDNHVVLPSPIFTAQGFTREDDATSWVLGNVRKHVDAGTPQIFINDNGRLEFPVGNTAQYRRAAITFETDDPAITDADIEVNHIDPGAADDNIAATAMDGYWLITSSVGFGPDQTFALEFLGNGLTVPDAEVANLVVYRRLDTETQNDPVIQGGTYSNFNTVPGVSPLVRVTDTQGGLTAEGARFSFTPPPAPPPPPPASNFANLQVIHNAGDTAYGAVDVYVDDVLALDNFAYRTATGLIALDVVSKGFGTVAPFNVDIAPSSSTSSAEAVFSGTVELEAGKTYAAVAVDDGAGGADVLVGEVRSAGSDPTGVDVLIMHGIADAPAVDIRLFQGSSGNGPIILENVSFTETAADYLTVDAATYTLEFLPTGTTTQALATKVDLSGLEGQPVLAIATGFLVPPFGREATRGANVMVVDQAGNVRLGMIVTATEEETTEVIEELPTTFSLNGNYPNPFNPSTSITFDLPETAEVSVYVVDMLGRNVLNVPAQTIQAGAKRTVQVSASDLASGTYLYRVIAKGVQNTWSATGKMILIK
jgi:hypothetical protein